MVKLRLVSRAMKSVKAKQDFLNWARRKHPMVVLTSLEVEKRRSGGVGAWTDVITSMFSTVKEVAPDLLKIDAQRRIFNAQLKRAEQGLPPLDVEQYSPTVKVSADITPEMTSAAKEVGFDIVSKSIDKYKTGFLIAGAVLIGLMVFRGRR